MRFVDTNVLLYAVSALTEDETKRDSAIALLREGGLALSVQVLQEFYHQATRRGRPGALTPAQALRFTESLDAFPIQPITLAVFRDGVTLSQRYRLSYWDGAILAAARALGCEAVYSEDMSADQDYGGVTVLNPFAH